MLGLYRIPDKAQLAASDDPRVARLRAAWPTWDFRRHPEGGTLAVPRGQSPDLRICGPVRTCVDGLFWHPPATLPTLHDLARDEEVKPSVRLRLRRTGTISIPLGVGPCYGAGPKRGQPSSEFGILARRLHHRAEEAEKNKDTDPWNAQDEVEVERLLFLGFRCSYHLTEELFGDICPYDLDEISDVIGVIWGNDPKASKRDGTTSPPSALASSATPG